MDSKTKVERCANQLLYGKSFLTEYEKPLATLLNDTVFRNHMNAIEQGQEESVVYSSDTRCSTNQKFKRNVLNQYFFEHDLYRSFPALKAILDSVVARKSSKLSGTISVFYAVKYLEHLQNAEKYNPTPVEPLLLTPSDADYRKKWEPKYRCEDGHYVRSKSEQLVDNWLYHHGVIHAYEKIVIDRQSKQEMICDFFLPKQNLYIEVWGYQTSQYLQRREKKIRIYQSNELRLVSMTDADIRVLDDFLSRMLHRH